MDSGVTAVSLQPARRCVCSASFKHSRSRPTCNYLGQLLYSAGEVSSFVNRIAIGSWLLGVTDDLNLDAALVQGSQKCGGGAPPDCEDEPVAFNRPAFAGLAKLHGACEHSRRCVQAKFGSGLSRTFIVREAASNVRST